MLDSAVSQVLTELTAIKRQLRQIAEGLKPGTNYVSEPGAVARSRTRRPKGRRWGRPMPGNAARRDAVPDRVEHCLLVS